MELLSVKQTAQRLDIHPYSLRRLEARGELLPVQRVGERRVYLRDDVEKVAQFRQARQAEAKP